MKKKSYLSGVILIGFGIYFLFQQYHFSLFEGFYSWSTLLFIVGLGFLANGYLGKAYESILPGVVLTGLGLHFHIANKLDTWPDHSGIFLLLVALGILLTYVKTGTNLFQGIIFLAMATLLLFFDRLLVWANQQGHNLSSISQFWPFLFIILGAYFLFFKKSR
ncbi:hypothetical protein ACFFF5_00175 [Lederbergia wuyishanensis]|uniref:DUF5668 domain-containing protein n=1 Tax=Lederbergia wuyishanensis TaxID=1347903 RepID=A0ABU0D1W2_9BACI|nr:hypothetical protein [Lederbergia wuyishanensis]MCJ8007009.1 hypothetical protein [Lederbergia wuyishanensis]MDQ0342393.1 hypothetical protein [Lederbergia wuyishanensis]